MLAVHSKQTNHIRSFEPKAKFLSGPDRWTWRHILAQANCLIHWIRQTDSGVIFSVHIRNLDHRSRLSTTRPHNIDMGAIYEPLAVAKTDIVEGHKMFHSQKISAGWSGKRNGEVNLNKILCISKLNMSKEQQMYNESGFSS